MAKLIILTTTIVWWNKVNIDYMYLMNNYTPEDNGSYFKLIPNK